VKDENNRNEETKSYICPLVGYLGDHILGTGLSKLKMMATIWYMAHEICPLSSVFCYEL
jgi:hypothetical protein